MSYKRLNDLNAEYNKLRDERDALAQRLSADKDEWQPGTWWSVLDPDGKLWCSTSDESEARERMRPGDTLYREYVMVKREFRVVDD